MEYNFDVKLKGNKKMFIDVHAHILDEIFENSEEVVERANFAGVDKIIIASADCKESEDAVNFASKHDNIFCMIGVHPENCGDFEKIDSVFAKLAQNKKVVAIGEIGLDYHYENPDKELQKKVFEKQILLADKLGLPIEIHSRDAMADTMEILKRNKSHLSHGGIFHCYSGSKEEAKEILKLGFSFSFGGVCTFKNARKVVEVLEEMPIENILLETDCPFLAPTPHRGETNEPKYIPIIAEKIAEIKGISLEEVAKKTTENAERIFKI